MKNIKSLLIIAGLFFTINMVNGQTLSTAITVVRQTQNQWCWAACSESVLKLYGTTSTQCEINNYAWRKTTCCSAPSGCNKPNELSGAGAIDDVLKHFGALNTQLFNSALTVAQIKTALTEKRPFVLACYWAAGGGHAIVGCVYDVAGSKLTMMDPWQNNGMTTCNFSGGSTIIVSGSQGNWGGTLVVTDLLTTGVNETARLSGIEVYPSPATSVLNINLPTTTGSYNVAICNYLGAVVKQTSIAGKTSTVDISSFTNGMYVVKVIDSQNAEAIFKVVKN